MILLSKSLPTTTRTLIRSPTITSITRRHASIKFTSNIPSKIQTTTSKSKPTTLPPVWSTQLFELPKPRPIDRQRYESTAGVVESGALVLAIALFGTMYGKGKDEVEEVVSDGGESVEDLVVHDWIRPFDFYVVEEAEVDAAAVERVAVKEEVKEEVKDEVVEELSPTSRPFVRWFWSQ